MKRQIIISFILAFLTSAGFSQTQTEMNQNAREEYQKAEKEINKIYQKVLNEYSSDTQFMKNLKKAERIWIQFRDAEIEARYPGEKQTYGTVYPMCFYNYMTALTNERIKTLNVWLDGIKEGDVCTGSVKTN